MSDAPNQSSPVSETLKPCPFCGGKMEEVTDEDGHYWVHPGRRGITRADCWLCDAWISDEPEGEGSIGEWNARADGLAQCQQQPTSLQDAVRGLNEALDDYWNTRRTDEGVKLICYWQFKCREALAQSTDPLSREIAKTALNSLPQTSQEPIGYGYSCEIQSGLGSYFIVVREKQERYDTPVYADTRPNHDSQSAVKDSSQLQAPQGE